MTQSLEAFGNVELLSAEISSRHIERFKQRSSQAVQSADKTVTFVQLYEGRALFSDLDLFLRAKDLDLFERHNRVRSPADGRLL